MTTESSVNSWGAVEAKTGESEVPTILDDAVKGGRPLQMMSFKDALFTCFILKFKTKHGRASQSEFGWLLVCHLLVWSITMGLGSLISPDLIIFFVPYLLLSLTPTFHAMVRRLHDCGAQDWLVYPIMLLAIPALLLVLAKGEQGMNAYGPPPTNVLAD